MSLSITWVDVSVHGVGNCVCVIEPSGSRPILPHGRELVAFRFGHDFLVRGKRDLVRDRLLRGSPTQEFNRAGMDEFFAMRRKEYL